jgi:hypothetical protein
MRHFKIALGYKTEHRNSEPTILASGYDVAALQAVIDQAPAEFVRFDLGVFQWTQRARRKVAAPAAVPVAPSSTSEHGAPTHPPTAEVGIASAVESVEESAADDDGPSLLGEAPASARRGKRS